MRPGVQFRDMSAVPLSLVVASLKDFEAQSSIYGVVPNLSPVTLKAEPPKGHPEKDALVFYMLNHAVSIIRKRVHPLQPLGKYMPLVNLFHDQLALRSARLYFYLTLICTRESRHEKGGSGMEAVYKKYPKTIEKFHRNVLNYDESESVQFLRKSPPACTVGEYTTFMSEQFYKGSYSSSFGGKAWGKVADVMRDFTNGKISAEMMLDTGFTLCHNGGPIFNKGMLYEGYSSELIKILDVQRSGQIPQLVAMKGVSKSKDTDVQALYQFSVGLLGEEFTGEVDWAAVEALGSKAKYSHEKTASMVKKTPMNAGYIIPQAKVVGNEFDADYEDDFKKTPEVSENLLQITPFDYIKVLAERPQ